jgi:cysteine synthase A
VTPPLRIERHPSDRDAPSRDILDAIGNTPLVQVDGVWAKLEFLNPSGSVKARLAKYVIERAEREGLLHAGDTIVEASSGNTGNALSMVAAVKGYRMIVAMPKGVSRERAAISRAFGAEVHEVGNFHVNEALEAARKIGERPGHFAPAQFESDWNVEENHEWLGPEILRQLPVGLVPEALISGVGTGGTLIGVGRAFREVNPACRLVALEPAESPTIADGTVGTHLLEGISDGFVPGIYDRYGDFIDEVVEVESEDAVEEMRRITREHGMLVGPTSGAHLLVAKRTMEAHPELSNVVVLFPDEGEKYLGEPEFYG